MLSFLSQYDICTNCIITYNNQNVDSFCVGTALHAS